MNYVFILIGVVYLLLVINSVRKNEFSVYESIFWIAGGIIVLLLSIFPNSIKVIAKSIGIDYAPSLLFMSSTIFLLIVNFRCSKKIAIQEEKIKSLAEEIAIIKGVKK